MESTSGPCRLIRMDRTGHTTLAEWTPADADAQQRALQRFREQLELGHLAVAMRPDGSAEQVRSLPLDAPLVVLRRPIAGGAG